MKLQNSSTDKRQQQYEKLKAQLSQAGWISEGTVLERVGTYQWTRKVQGKTITVSLSKEQYHRLKQAIENWRSVQQVLKQMQQISRQELFETVPGPVRHKKLSRKTLGIK